MEPIETAITGNEEMDAGLTTPRGALTRFYRAFNHRDLGLMQQVWLDNDEASMDNPIGGIRRGWSDIQLGYLRLFRGSARVYVEFHDYTLQQGNDYAIAVGRERGYCTNESERLELAIRTSRLFVRRNGIWRQLHHHGSIESGPMLSAYQKIISG